MAAVTNIPSSEINKNRELSTLERLFKTLEEILEEIIKFALAWTPYALIVLLQVSGFGLPLLPSLVYAIAPTFALEAIVSLCMTAVIQAMAIMMSIMLMMLSFIVIMPFLPFLMMCGVRPEKLFQPKEINVPSFLHTFGSVFLCLQTMKIEPLIVIYNKIFKTNFSLFSNKPVIKQEKMTLVLASNEKNAPSKKIASLDSPSPFRHQKSVIVNRSPLFKTTAKEARDKENILESYIRLTLLLPVYFFVTCTLFVTVFPLLAPFYLIALGPTSRQDEKNKRDNTQNLPKDDEQSPRVEILSETMHITRPAYRNESHNHFFASPHENREDTKSPSDTTSSEKSRDLSF